MKFTMIPFKFVSKSIATRFISNGSDFVDLVDSSIWLSHGHRFIDHFSNGQSNCRFLQEGKTFCPSNIYSSSSSSHPNNAINLQSRSSYFKSNNEPNSYICYDFKEMEVTPTHYSILSCASSQSAHPKPWCLEVSGDAKSSTKVHRCENNCDLNCSSQIGTYSVSRSVKCRLVPLHQTGKNHLNHDCLRFSGFEIFGVCREMRQS
jgi:hypothetical protein